MVKQCSGCLGGPAPVLAGEPKWNFGTHLALISTCQISFSVPEVHGLFSIHRPHCNGFVSCIHLSIAVTSLIRSATVRSKVFARVVKADSILKALRTQRLPLARSTSSSQSIHNLSHLTSSVPSNSTKLSASLESSKPQQTQKRRSR